MLFVRVDTVSAHSIRRHGILRRAVTRGGLRALLCAVALASTAQSADWIGHITRYDPALDRWLALDARIEKLAEGFTWSEGPVWIESGRYLLFSDVPGNTMYRWSEEGGLSVFEKPSGYAGTDLSGLREAGSNGLFADGPDAILLANSGDRSIERLELSSRRRTTLVAAFGGKRLNSPNDVIRSKIGVIFFTDPPYGLKDIDASPLKEQPFNGVYRIDVAGKLTVVDASLSFPNGVALAPDEKTLYVSNADAKRPIWMAYDLNIKREVTGKRQFADASDLLRAGVSGLPDGMKVGPDGTLFATAPGGVLVMTSAGVRLGRIETGDAIANCAFGDGGRWLYLTSHQLLARVALQPH